MVETRTAPEQPPFAATAAGVIPTTLWIAPGQSRLMAAVAERAGLAVQGVGTSTQGRAGELAASFGAGVKPLDDLRAAISAAGAGLFVIGDSGGFGAPGQRLDGEVLVAARGRGVRLASLVPLPASLTDLAALAPPGALGDAGADEGHAGAALGWAAMGPLMRATAPVPDLLEALGQFGPVRSGAITCLCAPEDGSLGARLLDAMDLALALFGEPEVIDASYASPVPSRGVHAAPGESLHDLRGDLTANLRFAGGRSLAVIASDQAARYDRAVTLIGPGGRISMLDDAFVWLGPDGRPVDVSRAKRAARTAGEGQGEPGASPFVDVLAEHLALVAGGSATPPPPLAPMDWARTLAMAQAALLSARTGEGESPSTMLKMAGG